MTTMTVYDRAMCCSTGICGADVDQKLVDPAVDPDWLNAQGVSVQRFGLSREPAEFAGNDMIRKIMQDSQGDDLRVVLVDGVLKAKARYSARAELAAWIGHTAPDREITAQMREAIAMGRMARKASERHFHDFVEKLIPEGEPDKASPCCGPEKASAALAGCCRGSAKAGSVQDGARSCCRRGPAPDLRQVAPARAGRR
ncbi:MAG: arsenite efflux transporter metallochaperone ArsD [Paracoccus sp. (in: a-proteobacteria)]|nr:arsenite efflux transporter metallochaperone ArsD [Paracoccus sp. (in: a-proteobacteria)]